MNSASIPLVLPFRLSPGGSPELRFALRSIHENWKGAAVVILARGRLPSWFDRKAWEAAGNAIVPALRYEDAIRWLETAPFRSVVWTNDDIFFCRPMGAKDCRQWYRGGDLEAVEMGEEWRAGNAWRERVRDAREWLRGRGLPTIDFAMHSPYVFDPKKVAVLRQEVGGFPKGKFPLEILYGNRFAVESRPLDGSLLRAHWERVMPTAKASAQLRFVNVSGRGWKGRRVRAWVEKRFGLRSPFEVDSNDD